MVRAVVLGAAVFCCGVEGHYVEGHSIWISCWGLI